MNLRLRNIKVAVGLSEETHAYTATLYADGKPLAYLSNYGRGGPDRVTPAKGRVVEDIADAEAYIRRTEPQWSGLDGTEHETTLEMWACDQVNAYLVSRELKRLLRSKLVLFDGGRCFTLDVKPDALNAPLRDSIASRYPGAVLAHDLSLDEALLRFRDAS